MSLSVVVLAGPATTKERKGFAPAHTQAQVRKQQCAFAARKDTRRNSMTVSGASLMGYRSTRLEQPKRWDLS